MAISYIVSTQPMMSNYSCGKLYNQCLRLLKTTASSAATTDLDSQDIFILKQSWGRLVLWDVGVENQNLLDETLAKSPILKDTVVQLLCGIGVALTRGKFSATRNRACS